MDDAVHPERPIRQAQRQQVLLGAMVEMFGQGPGSRHRVRDLSATGVRIDAADRLSPGATVLISVGVLEAVAATVIWVRDGLAGLAFTRPIDPDAARSRTLVRLAPPPPPTRVAGTGITPQTGWISELRSPYR